PSGNGGILGGGWERDDERDIETAPSAQAGAGRSGGVGRPPHRPGRLRAGGLAPSHRPPVPPTIPPPGSPFPPLPCPPSDGASFFPSRPPSSAGTAMRARGRPRPSTPRP